MRRNTTKNKKNSLLSEISSQALVGRGGASFPLALKIEAIIDSMKKEKEVYIVINAAEGEPGVKKDGYILNKHAEDFMLGVNEVYKIIGKEFVKGVYLYINKEYYKSYKKNVDKALEKRSFSGLKKVFKYFIKPIDSGYIGGEETAILNIIEGKKNEARFRPPYPTIKGLFSKPTLINNVETFYDVALLSRGDYRNERFYTISGAVKKPGVYRFSSDTPIETVLKKTGNYPNCNFFVQVGGNASGEILNTEQLIVTAGSAASIMVYDMKRTDEKKLINYWLKFYYQNSCGQCVTCREGTYRLYEMYQAGNYDEDIFWDIVLALDDSSFCALGSSLPVPLLSYYRNIKKVKINNKFIN